jgi:hypothetical protein
MVNRPVSQEHPCKEGSSGHSFPVMPLIKLNRINKGGDILVNSAQIVYIETEARSTTVHLTQNVLYSVEESPSAIAERIEQIETARIKNALVESGIASKPG